MKSSFEKESHHRLQLAEEALKQARDYANEGLGIIKSEHYEKPKPKKPLVVDYFLVAGDKSHGFLTVRDSTPIIDIVKWMERMRARGSNVHLHTALGELILTPEAK
jgi:hypothetical protein